MTQSPLQKSPHKLPPDFKARFGVVPDAPQPKMTRLQARRAKRKRFRIGMIVFALLLGTAGAAAFLVGQDYNRIGTIMNAAFPAKEATPPAASKPAAVAEAPAAASAPPPAKPASDEPPAGVAESAPPPTPPVAVPEAESPPAENPSLAAEAAVEVTPEEVPSPVADAATTPEPVAAAPPVAEPEPAPAVPPPPAAVMSAPLESAEEPQPAAPPPVAAAPAAAAPAPASPQLVTEAVQFPSTPVVGADSNNQAVTVTASEDTSTQGLAQAQPVPEPQAATVAEAPAQVAVATTPPAAAPAMIAPQAGTALVQGQVFRDCENCPDLVVVIPPAGLPPAQLARVKRPADAPPLQAFAIGRFEITFDDWARCMAGGGCTAQPGDEGWGRNTRPVINVSFEEASTQYIAWLSQVTGMAYRLPSASEWDFAEAGGGVVPASGVPLIDAQTICQSGNYIATPGSPQEAACADGFPTTAPVGSLKANALGLNDMRGNVWEWVSDCWTPGFTYKVKDSERDCRKHLLRGGSWSSRALLSAVPARGFEDAKRASKSIGFRVARALP